MNTKNFLLYAIFSVWITLAQTGCLKHRETGWLNIENKCYFASDYVLEWQAAGDYCTQAKAKLFIINSKQELDNVMTAVNSPAGIYYWVKEILKRRVI